jgi:cytochrome b involved in lipid metabolism
MVMTFASSISSVPSFMPFIASVDHLYRFDWSGEFTPTNQQFPRNSCFGTMHTYSRKEVSEHSQGDDVWMIISNEVYDLTSYLKIHPGGKDVLLERSGKDATEQWLHAGHSPKAQESMKRFHMGSIIESEIESFENSMHQGFLATYFPYISIVLTIGFAIFFNSTRPEHAENIYPVILGVFPSLFLILSGLKLWTGHTFRIHRIGGLLFLIQYALSWYFFFTNYEYFKSSFLVWSLLLNGCCQALSAVIEIGPTLEEKDSGEYFGNKNSTVSKAFITENLYYQLLTAFSSLYYYPQYYDFLHRHPIGKVIEIVWVFLPFVLIRPFFPKTLLREAIGNGDKISTDDHRFFFVVSNWAIKFCVLFGKHYVGFFVNAVRYLGGLNTPDAEKFLQFMMLANAGTVSISTFLHTLKFKNKLSPKVAMSIYLMILYTPAIAIYQLTPMCYPYWKLSIIFTIGMLINFCSKWMQYSWTILVTVLLVAYENGILPQLEPLISWK